MEWDGIEWDGIYGRFQPKLFPDSMKRSRNGRSAAAFPRGRERERVGRCGAVSRPPRKMAAPSSLLAWCVQHLRGDFGLDVGEEVVR